MAIAYNTNIVRSGLVLHHDPANIKSYSPNLVPWSETFTNAFWNPQNGITLLSTTELDPEGGYTATKLEDATTSQYSFLSGNITVPNDSQAYTLSIYVKKGDANSPGFAVNSGINGGSTIVASNQRLETDTGAVQSASVIDEGDYWRMYWTLTNNSTGNTNIYINLYPAARLASGGGDTITAIGTNTVWGMMVTRGTALLPYKPNFGGAADTLRDLKRNDDASIYNGAFYSGNGQGSITLDGSNDYGIFDYPQINTTGPYTLLQWVRPSVALLSGGSGASRPSGTNRRTTIVGPGPVWSPGIWVTADYLRIHYKTGYRDGAINWTTTTWNMIGMTYDGTSGQIVYGGEFIPIAHSTSTTFADPTTLLIGAESTTGGGTNWLGDVGPIMFYNRVLSADEVRQNFEALRGRYSV